MLHPIRPLFSLIPFMLALIILLSTDLRAFACMKLVQLDPKANVISARLLSWKTLYSIRGEAGRDALARAEAELCPSAEPMEGLHRNRYQYQISPGYIRYGQSRLHWNVSSIGTGS